MGRANFSYKLLFNHSGVGDPCPLRCSRVSGIPKNGIARSELNFNSPLIIAIYRLYPWNTLYNFELTWAYYVAANKLISE